MLLPESLPSAVTIANYCPCRPVLFRRDYSILVTQFAFPPCYPPPGLQTDCLVYPKDRENGMKFVKEILGITCLASITKKIN